MNKNKHHQLRDKANSFIGVPFMQYGVSFLRIFSLLILTRALEAGEYGDYTYLTTIVTLLTTITFAGGGTILLRLFSKKAFSKNIVYSLAVKSGLLASIISIIIFPLFIIYSNVNLSQLNFWILVTAALTLAPTRILSQVHNAYNKQIGNYVKIKASEFIVQLLFICTLFICYLYDLLSLQIAILLFIIQSILEWLLLRNKFTKKSIPKELKRKFFLDFRKLYPNGLFSYMVSSADLIMLGILSNSINVAYYGVGVKIYSMMTLFPASINMYFSSRIGNDTFFQEGKFAKYSRVSLTLCVVGSTFVFFFSDLIVNIAAGEKYTASAGILKILSIAFIFRSASYIFAANWIHLEKYGFLSMVSSINGILNIVLNIIFIPIYGAIAAASTSLFSYFIGFIINMYLLFKEKPVDAALSDYLLVQKADINSFIAKYFKHK